MSSVKETTLVINLAHLTHNYKYIKSKVDKNVKVLAVVKASGYGSDVIAVSKHLEKIGADYFAVAYTSEGVILREAGIKKPILVLHPQPTNFKKLIEHKLEPNIYSIRVLKEFIDNADSLNQKEYPIHIKFNTGLNRLGFREKDIDFIIKIINQTSSIKVSSLFSHLAASEDSKEKVFTIDQIETFKRIATKMIHSLGYKPMLHQCNTSGIFNYPEAHFDMVRTGIGLYGYGNDTKHDAKLKPVASLKSVISQILTLKQGETLGYSRSFVASEDCKTATIPIGHADGISRQYGNKKGFVIIHNKKAYIVGNVCMDVIMVDVSEIDCKEGDEVIIFDDSYSAVSFVKNAGTISYELLTAISGRVKRTIIEID